MIALRNVFSSQTPFPTAFVDDLLTLRTNGGWLNGRIVLGHDSPKGLHFHVQSAQGEPESVRRGRFVPTDSLKGPADDVALGLAA